MYWILSDILIPLALTFCLGVLVSWMWWKNTRSFASASSKAIVEGDSDIAPSNSDGISVSGLEAANIALIDERDTAARELVEVKRQLEELSESSALSDEATEHANNSEANGFTATLPIVTGLTPEQSIQADLEATTTELEDVKETLEAERRAKREVALELLNANNRLEKLSVETVESDTNSISIDRHKEEVAARDAQIRQLRGRLREQSENSTPAETVQVPTPVEIAQTGKSSAKSNNSAVVGWTVPEKKPAKKDRDELTQIKGVGPALEKLLHKAGIFHFEQLAKLDKSGVDELQEMLTGFPGRVRRDKWINQARQLHKKKYGTPAASS